jgi:hypothetical protein
MVETTYSESSLQEFLAHRISEFSNLISNLDVVREKLEAANQQFMKINPDGAGPNSSDLLDAIIRSRMLPLLRNLEDLSLAGVNIPLLETGSGGFKPSADIIAVDPAMGMLFLLELKKSAKTERD